MTVKHNKNHTHLCAQSISLLHLLHSVPCLPSRNDSIPVKLREQGYTLSFGEERRLTGALAFLSSANDNVNHIPALCVEEISNTSSLRVMLAVNRSGWANGNQFLHVLQQGFENVFATLEHEKPEALFSETRTMEAIVDMCSQRILRRLRLVENKRTTPKMPVQEVLRLAIDTLRRLNINMMSEMTATFINNAKDTIKAVDAWRKHRTNARLQDIVNEIYNLQSMGNTQAILDEIPNRLMDPSCRKSLINISSKVSRYRQVARFLCRMAKKHQAIRHMTVVSVNLPQDSYKRIPCEGPEPNLSRYLTEMDSSKVYRVDLARLCRLLKISREEANAQFGTQTIKTLKEAKIHAEIQLLYHYELNHTELPPRVIASSKDACFLCNAFIVMHGKTYIARSHGRIYPGWRLPIIPSLVDLEQRFNLALANQIRTSMAAILSRGQKTVYPDPNESTLLTLPHSASTIRSLLMPQENKSRRAVVTQIPEVQHIMEEQEPSIISESQTSSNNTNNQVVELVTGENAPDKDLEIREKNEATDCIAVEAASQQPPDREESASDEHGMEIQLNQGASVVVKRESAIYKAGPRPLELFMEYPMGATRQISSHSIEWLNSEDVENALGEGKEKIVNLRLLEKETVFEIDGVDGLLLSAEGIMVRIIAQYQ